MDIEDFFGSISFEKVYSCAFNTRYFPKFIGYILTSICTRKECLPQGAPTSPALSNIVMRNFDVAIGRYCKKRGITYTRYCDDMTFSADTSLYSVYEKVRSMLEESGFEINEKKTKFITNASRQSVTGLTVNEKVRVNREYKRNIRKEVYFIEKYGVFDAITFADRREYIEDGNINHKKYIHCLMGKIRYVLQIEPENREFRNMLNFLDSFDLII